MDRVEALEHLNGLVGKNLVVLARIHGINIYGSSGRMNKGWAGHTIEAELGLPRNSSTSPNFGSWELKQVSLRRNQRDNTLQIKETMAICMIDPRNVARKPFEDSHLYLKLRRMIVIAREYDEKEKLGQATNSIIHYVSTFDLAGKELEQVRIDYEEVRTNIIDNNNTIDGLSGRMGVLVQPRTKGPGGDAPKTRAFYARTVFVRSILGI